MSNHIAEHWAHLGWRWVKATCGRDILAACAQGQEPQDVGYAASFEGDNLYIIEYWRTTLDDMRTKMYAKGDGDLYEELYADCVENPDDKLIYQPMKQIVGPIPISGLSVDDIGNVLLNGKVIWRRYTS